MTVAHTITGTGTQLAICQLEPGQTMFAEAGNFLFKTTNTEMDTRLSRPKQNGQGGGGLMRRAMGAAMQVGARMLAGESIAFQYFTAQYDQATIGFGGMIPGEMRALELDGTRGWMAERDAFVAAEDSVEFGIAFSGLGAGVLGGEGFVLEKFDGHGTVLIAAAGNFIDLDLEDMGGRIEVHPGCIVAFQQGINYRLSRVGGLNRQGLMNAMFGGNGLALASLEGRGHVILQSLTMEGLVTALKKHDTDAHGGLVGNNAQDAGQGPLGGALGGLGGLLGG